MDLNNGENGNVFGDLEPSFEAVTSIISWAAYHGYSSIVEKGVKIATDMPEAPPNHVLVRLCFFNFFTALLNCRGNPLDIEQVEEVLKLYDDLREQIGYTTSPNITLYQWSSKRCLIVHYIQILKLRIEANVPENFGKLIF